MELGYELYFDSEIVLKRELDSHSILDKIAKLLRVCDGYKQIEELMSTPRLKLYDGGFPWLIDNLIVGHPEIHSLVLNHPSIQDNIVNLINELIKNRYCDPFILKVIEEFPDLPNNDRLIKALIKAILFSSKFEDSNRTNVKFEAMTRRGVSVGTMFLAFVKDEEKDIGRRSR